MSSPLTFGQLILTSQIQSPVQKLCENYQTNRHIFPTDLGQLILTSQIQSPVQKVCENYQTNRRVFPTDLWVTNAHKLGSEPCAKVVYL